MRNRLFASLAMLGVTAVWGITFVVVKDAIAKQSVTDFLTWRFGVATLLLILIRPKSITLINLRTLKRGVVLGGALGLGYLAQTFGLITTSAANSGFITGLFVVFTPIISGFLLRRHIGRWAWIASILATIGLGLISIQGWQINSGDALTVLCALAFALHIVGLGEWSSTENSYALAIVQLATVTLLSLLPALRGGLEIPPDGSVWIALAITALAATALAFVIQTWTQSIVSPMRTAVIMTMEPVFAGVAAVLIAHESLTWRTLVGGLLVLVAMYLVELGPKNSWQDVTHANH